MARCNPNFPRALSPTVALGVVLAVRLQKRMTLSETAVARLAQGDLPGRLPVSARGDDPNRNSQTINASLARLAAVVEAVTQVSTDIAPDRRRPCTACGFVSRRRNVTSDGDVEADPAAAIARSAAVDQR